MVDIRERFIRNSEGFWEAYRLFIFVFVVALICDAVSTACVMVKEGPDAEIHPVVRFVSMMLGPVAGPLFGAIGKAAAGMVVGVFWRRYAGYIFVAATIISLWATWYNITYSL